MFLLRYCRLVLSKIVPVMIVSGGTNDMVVAHPATGQISGILLVHGHRIFHDDSSIPIQYCLIDEVGTHVDIVFIWFSSDHPHRSRLSQPPFTYYHQVVPALHKHIY